MTQDKSVKKMPLNDEELKNIVYGFASNQTQLEEENKILKDTVNQLKNSLDKFKEPPLMVSEVVELLEKRAIIKIPNGNQFLVNIADGCDKVKPGDSVLTEQKNLSVIQRLNTPKSFNVEKFVIMEKPTLTFDDIGGLKEQIEEIKEVVELPLLRPELFAKVGITPPKGILLHGPPGTGKTILAKAVANATNSTFIEVVGSELVQKFIGEGAKLVNEIFELAREKAPAIIFIDEIDALAAKRIEIGTSGEREVQRTFMQFLAEIDGFKSLDNVKVIGCTNRKDILDPAILRPGRLDRLIHIDVPDDAGKKQIFLIHTRRMSLDKGVDIDSLIKKMEHFSGAEIKATVTEAGYFAIRANRSKVTQKDLFKAIEKIKKRETEEGDEYIQMFG